MWRPTPPRLCNTTPLPTCCPPSDGPREANRTHTSHGAASTGPNLEGFTHRFYSNDSDPDATDEVVILNYRQNLARFTEVKNHSDPENLFRLNTNVLPTV